MRRKSLLINLLSMVIILALILLTWKFKVHYYLTCTGICIASMIPIFFNFERKKPGAREMVIIAVFVSLSVASRVVFTSLPFIKPVIAMIMIAGFAFGTEVGFITGAITAFVSNFFFSQGAWTPWQMLAWGLAGIIAGILAKVNLVNGTNRITSTILGFVVVIIIVGPMLDLASVLTMVPNPKWSTLISFFTAGFPVNLSLAISTAVTLLLITGPMLKKLNRVKIKYNVFN